MNNLDQNNVNAINGFFDDVNNEDFNINLGNAGNINVNRIVEADEAEAERLAEEARRQEALRQEEEARRQEAERNAREQEERRAEEQYQKDVAMLETYFKDPKKLTEEQIQKINSINWDNVESKTDPQQEYWNKALGAARENVNRGLQNNNEPVQNANNQGAELQNNGEPAQNANNGKNDNNRPQENNAGQQQLNNEELQRQKEREELELAIARLKKEKQEMEQAIAKQKEEFEAAKANQAKELEEQKKEENKENNKEENKENNKEENKENNKEENKENNKEENKENNKEDNKENNKEDNKESEKKEEPKPEEKKFKNPNAKKGVYDETDNLLEITDKHADEAAKLKIVADMTVLYKKSSPEFKRMQKAIERFDKFMKGIKGRTTLTAEEMEKYDKYSHDVYKASDDYYKKKESEMKIDDKGNKVAKSNYEESRMKAAAEVRESVSKMRHEMFDKQIKAKVEEMNARCEQQLTNLENSREKIAAEGIKDADKLQPRIENNISHTIFYANRMAHLEKKGDLTMKEGESFSSAINRLNASTIPQKGEIDSIKDNKLGSSIIESGIQSAMKGKSLKNEEIKKQQLEGVKNLVPVVRNQLRLKNEQMQRRRSVANNRRNPENQRKRAGSMAR